MAGIKGRCECQLGRHHAPDCKNYIEVWRACPCQTCINYRDLPTTSAASVVGNQTKEN